VAARRGPEDRGGGLWRLPRHGRHGHRYEELRAERAARPGAFPSRVRKPQEAMEPIVILEGARRLPRADILHQNREPGLFSRFSTTQLGGMAIEASVAASGVDKKLVGHVVMGMAQHSHRDSIYAAKGMAWRG